jgi:hypothetical protein
MSRRQELLQKVELSASKKSNDNNRRYVAKEGPEGIAVWKTGGALQPGKAGRRIDEKNHRYIAKAGAAGISVWKTGEKRGKSTERGNNLTGRQARSERRGADK